jgi:acyl-CoA hydrolase
MAYPYVTAEEAVLLIKSSQRVFVQGAAATPVRLVKAMAERSDELKNVEVVHIHTEGEAPYVDTGMQDSFQTKTFFIGKNMRKAVQEGRADFIPSFLSEVPEFFREGILPIDVAMVHVSPPDSHGYCSLGTSVDVTNAAVDTARIVIAQVNPNMPRTHGDGMIHSSQLNAMVEVFDPIFEGAAREASSEETNIGRHIANLVEDGATLQMGIGAIPNAVLAALGNHKNLGIHSEMFSDGIVPLVEKGVINGLHKKIRHEKIVGSFVVGTRKIYDFIHDNPQVELLDAGFVNNTVIISKNPKVTAINSAIEVDLTGQVCADSIGRRLFSGVGGQVDFIRGASLSKGGRPIIALPSQTNSGISRIVPSLKEGAGVVTTRAHVHYIVTEYGVAQLWGKSLRQRAKALIDIAHPDHRERLEREAYELTQVMD